jgi:uncharacterized protein YpbB
VDQTSIREILASQNMVGTEIHYEIGEQNAWRLERILTARKGLAKERKLCQADLSLMIDMGDRRIRGMEEYLPATTDQNSLQMIDRILSRTPVAGMGRLRDYKAETLRCLHQDPTSLTTLIELL